MAGWGRGSGYPDWRGGASNRGGFEPSSVRQMSRQFGRRRSDGSFPPPKRNDGMNPMGMHPGMEGGGGFEDFRGPGWGPGGNLPSLLDPLVFPRRGGFHPDFHRPYRQHWARFDPVPMDYPGRRFGGSSEMRRRRRDRKFKKQRRRSGDEAIMEGEDEDDDDEEEEEEDEEEEQESESDDESTEVKAEHDGKKRKQSQKSGDEPELKMGKTESTGEAIEQSDVEESADAASNPAAEGDVLSIEEELAQLKKKLNKDVTPSADGDGANHAEENEQASTSKHEEKGKKQGKKKQKGKVPIGGERNQKKKGGFFENSGLKVSAHRITYTCSMCKFRTLYNEEMDAHLESKFHKDHLSSVSQYFDKHTMEFLEEHLNKKRRKVEDTVSQLVDHTDAVCQIYRVQDLTRGIPMEHFIRKAEAAHCEACDIYIPMQSKVIEQHLQSPEHNYNRRFTMEESKKEGLFMMRSILNHKYIRHELQNYLVAKNPQLEKSEEGGPSEEVGPSETAGPSEDVGPSEEAEPVGNGEGKEAEPMTEDTGGQEEPAGTLEEEPGGVAPGMEEEEGMEQEEGGADEL